MYSLEFASIKNSNREKGKQKVGKKQRATPVLIITNNNNNSDNNNTSTNDLQ